MHFSRQIYRFRVIMWNAYKTTENDPFWGGFAPLKGGESQFINCYQFVSCLGDPNGPKNVWFINCWGGVSVKPFWHMAY